MFLFKIRFRIYDCTVAIRYVINGPRRRKTRQQLSTSLPPTASSDRQAVGSDQMWWDISTGGMLQAIVNVVRNEHGSAPAISAYGGDYAATAPTAPPAPTTPPAAFGGGCAVGGDGGGDRAAWRSLPLSSRTAVAHATAASSPDRRSLVYGPQAAAGSGAEVSRGVGGPHGLAGPYRTWAAEIEASVANATLPPYEVRS